MLRPCAALPVLQQLFRQMSLAGHCPGGYLPAAAAQQPRLFGCDDLVLSCCPQPAVQIFQCHYLRYVYALFEDDDPPKYILDAGATRGPLACLTCALSAVRSQLVAQSHKRQADCSSRLLICATLQIAC